MVILYYFVIVSFVGCDEDNFSFKVVLSILEEFDSIWFVVMFFWILKDYVFWFDVFVDEVGDSWFECFFLVWVDLDEEFEYVWVRKIGIYKVWIYV